MDKYLLIAEKPSAMREYQKVYQKYKEDIDKAINGSIEFTALAGHIFRNVEPKKYKSKPEWASTWATLYKNSLPMIPDKWELEPIPSASDIISNLKVYLTSGNFTGIIVATDSDVEGYGIYYMVMTAMNLKKYKTLRFYETSMTEKDVLNSFLNMKDLFKTKQHANAIDAYIQRSHWDWLIGMNFSTAYTVRYGKLMKVGSVKAPTLKLIYDNCNLIDNFSETKSYAITSEYAEKFESVLVNEDNDKDRVFTSIEEANNVLSRLTDEDTIASVTSTKNIVLPDKLYSLSDLQVDASKLGYSPDDTLKIAQELYQDKKVLSYPRTSGNYLSSGKW